MSDEKKPCKEMRAEPIGRTSGYYARCECGWKARNTESTRAWAHFTWLAHEGGADV